jgi:hypothetical protein
VISGTKTKFQPIMTCEGYVSQQFKESTKERAEKKAEVCNCWTARILLFQTQEADTLSLDRKKK